MKILLNYLREKPVLYGLLKKIYGNTIGLWWLKNAFAKHIGFFNGRKRIKLLGKKQGDKLVQNAISSGKPFMLTRYGTTEFRNLAGQDDFDLLCFYSGFFPNNKNLLPKFRKVYFESSKDIDILVVLNYKNHFLKKLRWIKNFPNINYAIPTKSMGFRKSWKNALKNKKVLIVHPFKKTIESQYKKMDKLKILPKLKKLEVIRAVQTLADNEDPRFKDWFEALDYMKKEIDGKDFDVALIGCGAYGLPLASYVKSKGKQAVHLGGILQLLFGIKGKRWENEPGQNEYWTSPLKEDIPKKHNRIEGGCYW